MKNRIHRPGKWHGPLSVLGVALLLLAGACGKNTPSSAPSNTGGTPSPSASPTTAEKDPAIAAEVPADIAAKGSVVVAVDPTYAPNEFIASDNVTITGWDVDLGHAIGQVLGVNFNFQKAGFDGIIPGLQSGKYDIGMSSFTDNTDREKVVDMVTYYTAGTSFMVKASGGPDIESLDDLCGHSVAVEKGTTQLDDTTAQKKKCTDAGKPTVTILAFPDQNGANLALTSGRAEIGMADSPVAAYQTKLTMGQLKLSGPPYGVAPYGIVVPRPAGSAPGTGPMAKPILDALTKLISDGVYRNILQYWGVLGPGVGFGGITSPVINGATG
jgi:polar amino acid transport system substrate-binding protein